MKQFILPALLFLVVSSVLFAENTTSPVSVSWELTTTDFLAPGNGYLFTYSPALIAGSVKVPLTVGYGQFFTEGYTYTESLLYRASLGIQTDVLALECGFEKGIPKPDFLFFGYQFGIFGGLSYKFSPLLNVGFYIFSGTLENDSVKETGMLYNVISVFGPLYSGIMNRIDYRFDLSNLWKLGSEDLTWGIDNKIQISLFDHSLDMRLSTGYVEGVDSGIFTTMRYYNGAFTVSQRPGALSGHSFIAIQNTARFFFLEPLYQVPLLSQMLYISAFWDIGYFIPKDVKMNNDLFYTAYGVGLGLVFFKNDIVIKWGYNPKDSWFISFTMMNINLN